MGKDHKKGLAGTAPNIYPGLEIVPFPTSQIEKTHNSQDIEQSTQECLGLVVGNN